GKLGRHGDAGEALEVPRPEIQSQDVERNAAGQPGLRADDRQRLALEQIEVRRLHVHRFLNAVEEGRTQPAEVALLEQLAAEAGQRLALAEGVAVVDALQRR